MARPWEPGDDSIEFLRSSQKAKQFWDVPRVVLQIVIHRHAEIASACVQAHDCRDVLAAVPAKAEHPDPGNAGEAGEHEARLRVRRGVIDENDFEALSLARESVPDAVHERIERLGGPIGGNHDGDGGCPFIPWPAHRRTPLVLITSTKSNPSLNGESEVSDSPNRVPFNTPHIPATDLRQLLQAIANGIISGNGPKTREAEAVLAEMHLGSPTLLTTSCTHALELAARTLRLQPGDEVIVPSYTFVSTASAFVLSGATPVFCDVDPLTLNADPDQVEALVTEKTRAVCIVHYAGIAASPDIFQRLAHERGIALVEDNAHGLGGAWRGRPLGTFGDLSTLSFHETKNITCGEGGALIVNRHELFADAEILREKGTNRTNFVRGKVDKYTWVDSGSSWVMSDLLAGLLLGQLHRFDAIQSQRLCSWTRYFEGLSGWAQEHGVRLPHVPEGAIHTAHAFFLRFASRSERDRYMAFMKDGGVHTAFHYQALHLSDEGRRRGRAPLPLPISEEASETLVRLPLSPSLTFSHAEKVIDLTLSYRPEGSSE